MSQPTLANLEKQLRNAEARRMQLMMNTWVMPKTMTHYRTPQKTGEYMSHTDLVMRVIPNLKRRIARRREANAARQAAAAARQRRVARSVVKHWRGRVAKSRRSPSSPRQNITASLRQQLNRLRAAHAAGNRGNMVNIYYNMGRNWEKAGRTAGANVMNNAQMIMFRARLI